MADPAQPAGLIWMMNPMELTRWALLVPALGISAFHFWRFVITYTKAWMKIIMLAWYVGCVLLTMIDIPIQARLSTKKRVWLVLLYNCCGQAISFVGILDASQFYMAVRNLRPIESTNRMFFFQRFLPGNVLIFLGYGVINVLWYNFRERWVIIAYRALTSVVLIAEILMYFKILIEMRRLRVVSLAARLYYRILLVTRLGIVVGLLFRIFAPSDGLGMQHEIIGFVHFVFVVGSIFTMFATQLGRRLEQEAGKKASKNKHSRALSNGSTAPSVDVATSNINHSLPKIVGSHLASKKSTGNKSLAEVSSLDHDNTQHGRVDEGDDWIVHEVDQGATHKASLEMYEEEDPDRSRRYEENDRSDSRNQTIEFIVSPDGEDDEHVTAVLTTSGERELAKALDRASQQDHLRQSTKSSGGPQEIAQAAQARVSNPSELEKQNRSSGGQLDHQPSLPRNRSSGGQQDHQPSLPSNRSSGGQQDHQSALPSNPNSRSDIRKSFSSSLLQSAQEFSPSLVEKLNPPSSDGLPQAEAHDTPARG
eukprot:gb/GEZN01005681.1/.p1 GENE.gb/GEZN01005681.1/~~gb/GEZN01005681.1/.p1  ORF type:complete len:536 (-),score=75.97 gb/GEZN01005681.1/:127-1734(-)